MKYQVAIINLILLIVPVLDVVDVLWNRRA